VISAKGSTYTSCQVRARLSGLGVTHRRGGYRDPESQAFIESWFSKLKLRCVCAKSSKSSSRPASAAYIEGTATARPAGSTAARRGRSRQPGTIAANH
jgi:hypothetical protein